jgi:hypothetical protein
MNIPLIDCGFKYVRRIFSLLGARKTLITGSIPTENLPKKSHEAPKHERRSLVRYTRSAVEEPMTSSQSESLFSGFEDFTRQLDQK